MMTQQLSAQHNNDNGLWYVSFYFIHLTTKTNWQLQPSQLAPNHHNNNKGLGMQMHLEPPSFSVKTLG
jgi:hypothetical protein